MQLNIDEMNIIELKAIIQTLVRLSNHEHDRLTALQDRVLELELAISRNHDTVT